MKLIIEVVSVDKPILGYDGEFTIKIVKHHCSVYKIARRGIIDAIGLLVVNLYRLVLLQQQYSNNSNYYHKFN